MRFLGAKVVLTPQAGAASAWWSRPIELAKTHGWFLTRQFENEANPDIHSRTTAREIIDDFKGEKLDYWVTGYGTGGTLKGVSRVLAKEMPDTKIVVCEPEDAPLLGSGTEQERNAGRLACRAASRLQAASDAGLDAGLHPEAHRATPCDMKVIDQHHPHPRRRRHQVSGSWRRRKASSSASRAGATFAGALKVAPRRRRAPPSSACCPTPASAICSTPLFANVPADMTDEELEISRSTPSRSSRLRRRRHLIVNAYLWHEFPAEGWTGQLPKLRECGVIGCVLWERNSAIYRLSSRPSLNLC